MNTLALEDRASYLNLRTSPGLKQRHWLWYQITLLMAGLFIVCSGLVLVDDRTLMGVSV
jgi:hypothetical protein